MFAVHGLHLLYFQKRAGSESSGRQRSMSCMLPSLLLRASALLVLVHISLAAVCRLWLHLEWQCEEASWSVRASRMAICLSGKEPNTTQDQVGCAVTLERGREGGGKYSAQLIYSALEAISQEANWNRVQKFIGLLPVRQRGQAIPHVSAKLEGRQPPHQRNGGRRLGEGALSICAGDGDGLVALHQLHSSCSSVWQFTSTVLSVRTCLFACQLQSWPSVRSVW